MRKFGSTAKVCAVAVEDATNPFASVSGFAAVRMRFEKDGTLGRIASRIRTEKTLGFLFEQAVKTTPPAAE